MTRHSRISALTAALVTAAVGVSLLAATGQFHSADLSSTPADALKMQAAGSKDPAIWNLYANKLRSVEHFGEAAAAYQHVLELRPNPAITRQARIDALFSLSQAKDADGFYDYFARVTAAAPKLAVDLLDRPELTPMRGDIRWESAAANARDQAQD